MKDLRIRLIIDEETACLRSDVKDIDQKIVGIMEYLGAEGNWRKQSKYHVTQVEKKDK